MIRKNRIISFLIIIGLILITPNCYAKIEIKPSPEANANRVMVNSNISNSYEQCQKMKDKGGNLYGTNVKPHLATNKDWGAVSYLSNSMYGTNTKGQNTGVIKNINGVDYYSTNGNASGVMNWGSNPYKTKLYTQTSAILQSYMDLSESDRLTKNAYVTALAEAADNNSKYVEIINLATYSYFSYTTAGMGFSETENFSFSNRKNRRNDPSTPISGRSGLFGYQFGGDSDGCVFHGEGLGYVTFRPVIWNQ